MTREEIQAEADKRYPPLNNHIAYVEEVQDALNDGFVVGAEWMQSKADVLVKEAIEMGKPKWISVEDKLPSYDKHYVNMLVYSAASFIAYYDGCKWWVCGPEQVEIKPSHWMPLPEIPITE